MLTVCVVNANLSNNNIISLAFLLKMNFLSLYMTLYNLTLLVKMNFCAVISHIRAIATKNMIVRQCP